MTHGTPDEDPAELVAAVSDLAVMVERQSAALETLSRATRANTVQTDVNTTQTEANTAQSKRNTSSNRRHRIALTIGGLGLVLDMLLSGLFIYQHQQQTCQNRLADNLFHAEYAKVSGQIAGIDRVLRDPHGGVVQFRAASQHYLDRITELNRESC